MKKNIFKHLTDTDRIRLEVLLREGFKPIDIAKRIGVHRSTISREIKIRGTPSGYHARIAQVNYQLKRVKCRPKRIIEETSLGSHVIEKIRAGWSPKTISGRLKLEISWGIRTSDEYINQESIYQFVYLSDYGRKEKLYEYLRHGKKHRTRKHGRKSQKVTIPNRVLIDLRPKEVEKRKTIGHWEGDTIHYPRKYGINSLLERKARYVILTKIEQRTAALTTQAITQRLEKHKRESLTLDNGRENTLHETITQILDLPIFFCNPYHSWEKGSCENMNGLVRRYLPRNTDLGEVSQEDIDDIAWELNNRPREILGFLTPKEVLEREYTKITNFVAFDY